MKLRNLFVFFVILAVVALPALAQERSGPVGKMSVSSSALQWQSGGHFESMVLTITTPSGAVITREFRGSIASFKLADLAPHVVEEGTYQYELRAVPKIPDSVRAALTEARERDDDAAVAQIQAANGLAQQPLQAGAFTIHNGSFMTDVVEPPAHDGGVKMKATSNATAAPPFKTSPNDVVTADDEIIQGSLCVGLDCVANESFGFDTIRLKENNTRIKFLDTSTTSGCPNNVWQLTANDACGGANKFSIEDITGSKVPFTITAAAPTNSLFVASTGKVGFGNNSPGLNLHITATDTPAIRQEQTNGGGFTAQTWDIGGNEANWFVRDLTGGSRLPFRIRPGAPTSSVDIAASGNVGFGTASPSNRIHAFDSTDVNTIVNVQNTSVTSGAAAVFRSNSDTAQLSLFSHASARTLSRFGVTLGGWNEINAGLGNGLIVGTNGAMPLILGTNSTNRLQIDGTTGAITTSGNLTVNGNFTVTGTKSFAMPDPSDAKKAIYYVALEGPEAGTYFRGTAKTVNGEAIIELPGYFSNITEKERMTVQLTPVGAPGQLYVAEKTPGRLVIKVANGANDAEFDYLVQGVRKGYLGFEVERQNDLPQN
jgi:hypothetical protein